MNLSKSEAIAVIENKSRELCQLSDALWDHPEIGYHEIFAAQQYCELLEKEGFQVQKDLAGIKTAFSGTFGSGKPVIGFLGEFDALPGLSQEAGCLEKSPIEKGAAGHGCGHNLLGVGSLAAAIAVKEYIKENGLAGTVIFYGCPAEEGGAGKGFMVRDDVFEGVDIAFSWHPGEVNGVSGESTMANYQACYHFYGVSSHAAMSPEMGRSAVDAMELMNTGVQYLREHMPSDNRVHYAITDGGGKSPGIVQPYAEVLYLMRAPKLEQAKDLYDRVTRIAQGAAMMTDTRVEVEFVKACSNMVMNTELMKVLQKNFEEIPPKSLTEEDFALAHAYRKTLKSSYSYFNDLMADASDPEDIKRLSEDAANDIHNVIMPFPVERQGFASSDVADVSCVCPVAQISAATMPAGIPMHSWQEVAVGKTNLAHKGMLYAGEILAGAAIDALEEPSIIDRAKAEMAKRTGGRKHVSPIPKDVSPRIP